MSCTRTSTKAAGQPWVKPWHDGTISDAGRPLHPFPDPHSPAREGGIGNTPPQARKNGPGKVFLTTDAVGGVWRYTVELCHGLAARGRLTELHVVGPQPSGVQRRELPQTTRLFTSSIPLDWLAETARDFDLGAHGLATDADVALIHAPALIGATRWKIPVATIVHSCLTTWFDAVRGGPVPPDYAWRAEATATGLRRADAVAAPTRAFADTVQRTYGLPAVTAIHNGRRPIVLPDVPRARAVLTACRLWDDGKNIAVLDRAAAGLSAPVRAAGPRRGPDGWDVTLHHVQPLGPLEEAAMAHALASHSVFAAPALYEPFGLAVLEAAQSGLALVLSDIPTFRELWDGAALFVPPSDPAAWRAALERALAAPHSLAALAQKRARRYTVEACVDGTLGFLSRMMAAPP